MAENGYSSSGIFADDVLNGIDYFHLKCSKLDTSSRALSEPGSVIFELEGLVRDVLGMIPVVLADSGMSQKVELDGRGERRGRLDGAPLGARPNRVNSLSRKKRSDSLRLHSPPCRQRRVGRVNATFRQAVPDQNQFHNCTFFMRGSEARFDCLEASEMAGPARLGFIRLANCGARDRSHR